MKPTDFARRLHIGLARLQKFPWRTTTQVMQARFREDRLGLTAGSLTFTTLTSLVPLVTVALAIFSAFPKFAQMQLLLQAWMTQNLFPKAIASSVMTYIGQFASKANRLGLIGSVFLFLSALAVMLTVDGTLNKIWRVRRPRPLAQRVLVYWAGLTLGPLVLTASLALSSYAVVNSRELVGIHASQIRWLSHWAQFFLIVGLISAAYRFVPNTPVRWGHACAGGFFVALGIELARRALGLYIGSASISSIYGAFAILPLLLLWLYILWVIVLLGAVIAAYLPSIQAGIARRGDTPSFTLELALETLTQLDAAKHQTQRGLSLEQLAGRLRVSTLQLEPAIELLQHLDWIGQLAEESPHAGQQARLVLLADLSHTPLQDLLAQTVLPPSPTLAALNARIQALQLQLADATAKPTHP